MQNFDYIFNSYQLFLGFIIFAIITIITSNYLSKYADILSYKKSIDGGLIGLFLLAIITSLPELSVSISSIINQPLSIGPNLAVGNMLGSNLFNLLIIGILGLIFTNKFISNSNNKNYNKYILQSVLLLITTWLIFQLSNTDVNSSQTLSNSAYFIYFIPILYLFFIHINKKDKTKNIDNKLTSNISFSFYIKFILFIMIIILCGIVLTFIAGRMALPLPDGGLGLSSNLIGTLFLALATSLPELALAFSCIKIGQISMALGNILGSNLFNLLIIFICSLFLKEEQLLACISNHHEITFISITVLSLLLFYIINAKNIKKIRAFSILLIITYVLSIILIS
ncbi:MAG: sodium:calcium antiporter [Pontiellaceae bacterium]